jgi:TolB-like protein
MNSLPNSAGVLLKVIPTFAVALATVAAVAAPVSSTSVPEKPAIAVLNLKESSGVTTGEAELLSDRLRAELFNTGSFTVMERDQMQQVLKEQGFQKSGACTDATCMVEIGQLLGVKQIITGSIGRLGSMFLVNLRSIDVTTGKILKVVSQDVKGSIEDLVGVLPGIAASFAGGRSASISSTEGSQSQESSHEQTSEHRDEPAPDPGQYCTGKLHLEAVSFSREDAKLGLTPDEYTDLNKDINGKLLDALNNRVDDAVVADSRDRISQNASCQDPVVRIKLNGCTTQPARMGQTEMTADVVVCFYDNSSATTPSYKVPIVKTGDRHWGQSKPFVNAFEAISDELNSKLRGEDYIKKLKERVHK